MVDELFAAIAVSYSSLMLSVSFDTMGFAHFDVAAKLHPRVAPLPSSVRCRHTVCCGCPVKALLHRDSPKDQ